MSSAPLDLDQLWQTGLELLAGTVTSLPQQQWLQATHPVGFANDTVILASPNEFVRSFLEQECAEAITKAVSAAAGRDLTVMLTVQPHPEPLNGAGHPRSSASAEQSGATTSPAPAVAAVPSPQAPPLEQATPQPAAATTPSTSTPPSSTDEHGFTPPPPAYDAAPPLTTADRAPATADRAPATADRAPATADPFPDRSRHSQAPAPFEPAPFTRPPHDQGHDNGLRPSPGLASQPAQARTHADHAFDRLGFGAEEPTVDTSARPLEAPGRPAGDQVQLPPRRVDMEVEPDTQLNPKYVFDHFVIGASNRFAHAAAFAVAEAPAKAYNPLFIYGGSGLGKTHLLHAIGHYVRSLYPRLRIRYVTTEQFTNEFITAVKDARMPDFQRLYRQTDLLLVDDIQFLSERERTQEEFFHTFNALHMAEKQIVLSSDRPPRQIARLEDRLRNRFEWGLMTDIQPPDLETRIAILRRKTGAEHLDVADDVLEFIASRVQSNIRELEGALIRVTAYASLQRRPADRSMAEQVLKDLFPGDHEQHISVHLIMDEVAGFFDFTVDELKSKSRTRKLSTARQIAMYLTRELTEMSLPKIGGEFGGRDHTTVLHANNKIADLMGERQQIYDQVQELTNRIKTRARTA